MGAAYTIQVPASSTNLGAGFDSLGLALGLYLKVQVQESPRGSSEIEMEGEGARELLSIRENLMWRVIRRVFQGEGRTLPPLRLEVHNAIPLARGLGSSAAAIVAALGTYEALAEGNWLKRRFSATPWSSKAIRTTLPPPVSVALPLAASTNGGGYPSFGPRSRRH